MLGRRVCTPAPHGQKNLPAPRLLFQVKSCLTALEATITEGSSSTPWGWYELEAFGLEFRVWRPLGLAKDLAGLARESVPLCLFSFMACSAAIEYQRRAPEESLNSRQAGT